MAAAGRADEGAAAAPQAPAPAVPAAQAAYVGSDTCIACHEDQQHGYEDSPHGRAANPRAPAAMQGCESCHGPGERHIDDPTDDTAIRKFAKMTPRDVSATCLTCHARGSHASWQGSPHDARNLSCVTCHDVHPPEANERHLRTASEVELCATCHRVQALKIKRVSHMPVPEGKMQCSFVPQPARFDQRPPAPCRHRLTERVALGVAYAYDHYSVDDFALSPGALNSPVLPTMLSLMYQWRPYSAHTGSVRVIYSW